MGLEKWILLLPLNLIYEVAAKKNVEPELIAAIVSIESNGNACATRFEPHYKYLLDVPGHSKSNYISFETERVHQQTSWGLMQVMGGVAREYGYDGPLVRLCEPKIGLKYGVAHLKKFYEKYGTIEQAISAYNQGSDRRDENGDFANQDYVDKVLSRYYVLRNYGR